MKRFIILGLVAMLLLPVAVFAQDDDEDMMEIPEGFVEVDEELYYSIMPEGWEVEAPDEDDFLPTVTFGNSEEAILAVETSDVFASGQQTVQVIILDADTLTQVFGVEISDDLAAVLESFTGVLAEGNTGLTFEEVELLDAEEIGFEVAQAALVQEDEFEGYIWLSLVDDVYFPAIAVTAIGEADEDFLANTAPIYLNFEYLGELGEMDMGEPEMELTPTLAPEATEEAE